MGCYPSCPPLSSRREDAAVLGHVSPYLVPTSAAGHTCLLAPDSLPGPIRYSMWSSLIWNYLTNYSVGLATVQGGFCPKGILLTPLHISALIKLTLS